MNTEPVYILLVDDEDALVGILASQLTDQFGYVTRIVRDGQEAIDLLQQAGTLPSLIITDYDMPNVNGLELTEWVQERTLGIPVIMLTAAGGGTIESASLRAGVYDYVRKETLDLQRLGLTIQSVLERRRLRSMEEEEKERQQESSANKEATDRLHAVVTNLQPSLMDGFASVHNGLDLLQQRTQQLSEGDRGTCGDLIQRMHHEVRLLEGSMRTLLELYAFTSSHHSHLERIEELLESTKKSRRR
ncbi:MAG: response regulator [Bacteroidetes bacterium]|jgi:CheY-like chemotaxis protein|nr:response regulator [Bacteroidota bacterium]